jgi:hypothetical protein
MSDENCSHADNTTADWLARIDEALNRRDGVALRSKGRRLTFAVTAAALGPIAVLLLGLHLVFGKQLPFGGGLVFLELMALTFALAIPFLRLEQSHYQWLSERLRAELLRRERFFLLARIGPYLGASDATIAIRVEHRLAGIDDDINDAFSLLGPTEDALRWRKNLEDSRHDILTTEKPSISITPDDYLRDRILAQRRWYSRKAIEHGKHAWWLEGGAKMTLTFALIVAAVHLGIDHETSESIISVQLLSMGALLLPAVGAALIGLLSIFGCRRLSRSYMYHAHALEALETVTRALQADALTIPLQDEDVVFQFRRILLETEELLSNELRLWWLYMHPEAPRAAA